MKRMTSRNHNFSYKKAGAGVWGAGRVRKGCPDTGQAGEVSRTRAEGGKGLGRPGPAHSFPGEPPPPKAPGPLENQERGHPPVQGRLLIPHHHRGSQQVQGDLAPAPARGSAPPPQPHLWFEPFAFFFFFRSLPAGFAFPSPAPPSLRHTFSAFFLFLPPLASGLLPRPRAARSRSCSHWAGRRPSDHPGRCGTRDPLLAKRKPAACVEETSRAVGGAGAPQVGAAGLGWGGGGHVGALLQALWGLAGAGARTEPRAGPLPPPLSPSPHSAPRHPFRHLSPCLPVSEVAKRG